MKAISILLVSAALPLVACSGGNADPDPADLPYGTVQQMMANEVQPTADTYWAAVKFESELMDDGTVEERDIRPETDADWEKTRAAAAHLGELGKALGSPAYSQGRGEDWTAFANGLVEVSALAEKAAVDKDPDAVFEVGGNVYNVCKACHQMYPPAEGVEGEGGAMETPAG